MRAVVAILLVIGVAAAAGMWLSSRPEAPEPVSMDPIAAAWSRVGEAPKDPERWLRLAELQLEIDELSAAERSLRASIELGDATGEAEARLGFLLYGQGRDDEARVHLERALRLGARVPMLEATLRRLAVTRAEVDGPEAPVVGPGREGPKASPSGLTPSDAGAGNVAEAPPPPPEAEPEAPVPPLASPDPGPGGPCTLPLDDEAGPGTLRLSARIAGLSSELIVDTGASLTLITESFASAAGLSIDTTRVVRAVTANGRIVMPTAVVPYVEVGGRRIDDLRVAVCDECTEDVADGLLGLDVQSLLEMQIDPKDRTIRFGDCDF